MMTVADKLEREFGLIKRDDRGFADYDLLAGFRARCAHATTGIEYPHGTDSYDSSETFLFPDGSYLTLDNPRQAAYAARVSRYRVEGRKH